MIDVFDTRRLQSIGLKGLLSDTNAGTRVFNMLLRNNLIIFD